MGKVSFLGSQVYRPSASDFSLLEAAIDSFPKNRVLVIGDVGVDEYLMGEVKRISPEAPVPVLEVQNEDTRLGLSANVAQNIKSLGGQPLLLSVVGADEGASRLRKILGDQSISDEFLVVDPLRPTTRKARVMAKQHHLVRIDFENRDILTPEIQAELFSNFQKAVAQVSIVIVQDYAKGIFSPEFYKKIIQESKLRKVPVLVDPHRTYKAAFYEGCDLIKPNWDEAVYLTDFNEEILRRNPETWVGLGRELLAKTKAKQVVLTKGPDGMFVFDQEKITHVPTQTRQVFDVTGAGDTAIATLSLSLASGVPTPLACVAANLASGVVIAQVGCVPCYASELKAELRNLAELVAAAPL